jgi:hypothetical protein
MAQRICKTIGYEIGYRLRPVSEPYATPYTDLGVTPLSAADYPTMNTRVQELTRNFPNAEWRLVEVVATVQGTPDYSRALQSVHDQYVHDCQLPDSE